MLEINKIYNMDNIIGCKLLDNDSIDLVITSPPYDDLRCYKGYSFEFEDLCKDLYRVLKPGGRVVWIVNDSTKNFDESGTSFKQALYFKQIGFKLNDTMIWRKTNPVPMGFPAKRYTPSFEYMFVFSKEKPKVFNPILVPVTTFRHHPENDVCNRKKDGAYKKRYSFLSSNTKKIPQNVFDISIGSVKDSFHTRHPAAFSIKLAMLHVLTWSNSGDLILDPFIGSGSTAIASLLMDRNYIGFELASEYCNLAEERISYYKENKQKFYEKYISMYS